MKPTKIRADELVWLQGLARSRSQSRALIMAGRILAENGQRVEKAGELWPEDSLFHLREGRLYVSRGGDKLAGALLDLGFSPDGLSCIDIGASTGGFTDCLLQNGAIRVTAVDVGKGLIDYRLRNDPRVTVVENLNARLIAETDPALLKAPFDLAVADVSFISLELILPGLAKLITPEGHLLVMVKPQFEVGREQVGKKGVVRDPELIKSATDKISQLGPGLTPPLSEISRAPSRLPGPEGNQEVFILFGPKED